MDEHLIIHETGIMPWINLWGLRLPTYSLMILIGLGAAAFTYAMIKRGMPLKVHQTDHGLYILLAAIVGGALGAKLPIWWYYRDIIFISPFDLELFMSGRTVMGGLIGGFIAVQVAKVCLKSRRRIGNQLAPAIAIGMAFGRLGCFLRGCCVGATTTLPFGVNFGDGILRHPAQLYEMIFHAVAAVLMLRHKDLKQEGGGLMTAYLTAYFIFRFFVEELRIEPQLALGLTLYQWLCLVGLGLMGLRQLKVGE